MNAPGSYIDSSGQLNVGFEMLVLVRDADNLADVLSLPSSLPLLGVPLLHRFARRLRQLQRLPLITPKPAGAR